MIEKIDIKITVNEMADPDLFRFLVAIKPLRQRGAVLRRLADAGLRERNTLGSSKPKPAAIVALNESRNTESAPLAHQWSEEDIRMVNAELSLLARSSQRR